MRFIFIKILLISFLFSEKDYFQQHVSYEIDVELNDSAHTLSAYEKLIYKNNSSDKLKFIWFHIWPNAYKNDSTAFAKQQFRLGSKKFRYTKEKDRGYIDSLDFSVNGIRTKWEFHPNWIDVVKVHLIDPLNPGDSAMIETPFFVKLPKVVSRLGHTGKHYEITQWYPKPAVFDKYGWHPMPYTNMGEFYSEFGTFNVKITLPKEYRIMATGDIVNGEKEYKWLDSLAAIGDSLNKLSDKEFDRVIKSLIKDQKKRQKKNKESKNLEKRLLKTVHFRQSRVHDFAWFADPHWIVEKGVLKFEESKKEVTLWSMYLPKNAKMWRSSIEYLHDSGYWFSQFFGEYPYNHITAVDGDMSAGGGMEYPNITVISRDRSKDLLEYVIMHEVGHNWLYGILGSNERDHPWMDEGLNEWSNIRYWEKKYSQRNNQFILQDFVQNKLGIAKDFNIHLFHYLAIPGIAKNQDRQPLSISSNDNFNMSNYGQNYTRVAVMMRFLQHYIGEEKIDMVNQEFYETWKFRHPQPYDYISIFKKYHNEDLSWFFDHMLNKATYIDYGIKKGDIEFYLTNFGTFNVPVEIAFYDDIGNEIDRSWVQTDKNVLKLKAPLNSIHATIDPDQYMPDIFKSNNSTKRKIKTNFLFGIPNYHDIDINIVPWLFSYNTYNGFAPGLSLWNGFLPGFGKRSTVLNILYDTKNKKPIGNLIYGKQFDGLSIFHSGSWGLRLSSIEGRKGLRLNFTGLIKTPLTKSPTLKFNTNVFYHSLNENAFDPSLYDYGNFLVGIFNLEKKWIPNILNNYFIGLNIKAGNGFAKTKIYTGLNYSIGRKSKTSLLAELRTFIYSDNIPKQYRDYLYGSVDPDFQKLVIDRKSMSDNLKILQNTYHGGGIRGIDPNEPTLGSSNIFWKLNIDQSIPFFPGKLFTDIAGSPDFIKSTYIASGIVLGPIIIPLFQSWELQPVPKDIEWIQDRIRFQFNLSISM